MLINIADDADHIYIACGFTDFRKQTESLSAFVSLKFNLDQFSPKCVFLFCNKKKNSIKALRWDDDGFILVSKKLMEEMKFQWPKDPEGIRDISSRELRWLFADTPKGAESSAIAYSIVETAKANNLNVFQYLAHLLRNLHNINFKNNQELLAQCLPWSGSLPKQCYIEGNKKSKESTCS